MSVNPYSPQGNYQNVNTASYPSQSYPSASVPTGGQDSFTNNASLQSLIQGDPQLAAEWNNLSPQQQQEVSELFSLFGGSQLPQGNTNGNGNTTNPSQKNNAYTQDRYVNPNTQSYPTSQSYPTTQSYTSNPSNPGTPSNPTTGSVPTTTGSNVSGASGQVYGDQNAKAGDPSIKLQNNSNQTRYYFIEGSAGADPQGLSGKTIAVPPGGSATINPGKGFNGAITDNGTNSTPGSYGTRMEYNATDPSGKVWYDADTERGNTNATFGPASGKNADDGRTGLVGNNLSHYYTHGAVAGQAETADDKISDTGTHVITGDPAFVLTSTN